MSEEAETPLTEELQELPPPDLPPPEEEIVGAALIRPSRVRTFKLIVWCTLLVNAMLVPPIVLVGGASDYMRVGPHAELEYMSVKLDTWPRYGVACVYIVAYSVVLVLLHKVCYPMLDFTIYDPTVTHVAALTRGEMLFYGNVVVCMILVGEFVLVSLELKTQLDLALLSLLTEFVAEAAIVGALSRTKTFRGEDCKAR